MSFWMTVRFGIPSQVDGSQCLQCLRGPSSPPTGLGGGGSAGRPSPTGDIPAQTPSQRQILAMTHANNAQGTANAISGIAQVTNVVNNGGVL